MPAPIGTFRTGAKTKIKAYAPGTKTILVGDPNAAWWSQQRYSPILKIIRTPWRTSTLEFTYPIGRYSSLESVTYKRWSHWWYSLRRQIIDNTRCGIVLFSQWEQRCNAWKSDSHSKPVSHVIWNCLPMPESKSGTNAANVMIRSWISLRLPVQFWGSFSESVGWGHNTFVPSLVSLRRAATSSPSSTLASLCDIIHHISSAFCHKKEYTLGINDETTGILFMKRE